MPQGLRDRIVMSEDGLVFGDIRLAKMGDEGLCIDGEEERILTLLAVAYGDHAPRAPLDVLRRVSQFWQSGDKCLAMICLEQGGFRKLDKDAVYRLSKAAGLLDEGVAARGVVQALGLSPFLTDFSKYDPDQPRVPAGNGRESGRWMEAGGSAADDSKDISVHSYPDPVEGRSAGKPNRVEGIPKDAVAVRRPDGTTIDDPQSPAGKLMAPPHANFQQVYAAGEKIARWPLMQQYDAAEFAIGHFGTYDFQRDKAPNRFFVEYIPAANYAVGVYTAGAGYTLEATYIIAQRYALSHSSNWYDYWSRGRPWIKQGWEDARRGYWKKP